MAIHQQISTSSKRSVIYSNGVSRYDHHMPVDFMWAKRDGKLKEIYVEAKQYTSYEDLKRLFMQKALSAGYAPSDFLI